MVLRDVARGRKVLPNHFIADLRAEPAPQAGARSVQVSFTVRNVSDAPAGEIQATVELAGRVVGKTFLSLTPGGTAQKTLTVRSEAGGPVAGAVIAVPRRPGRGRPAGLRRAGAARAPGPGGGRLAQPGALPGRGVLPRGGPDRAQLAHSPGGEGRDGGSPGAARWSRRGGAGQRPRPGAGGGCPAQGLRRARRRAPHLHGRQGGARALDPAHGRAAPASAPPGEGRRLRGRRGRRPAGEARRRALGRPAVRAVLRPGPRGAHGRALPALHAGGGRDPRRRLGGAGGIRRWRSGVHHRPPGPRAGAALHQHARPRLGGLRHPHQLPAADAAGGGVARRRARRARDPRGTGGPDGGPRVRIRRRR